MTPEVQIREFTPADEAAVLALLGTSLRWTDDPFFGALFRWKHRDGPWGPSPAWVAVDQGAVVGFRAFLRWRFVTADGPVTAVRAVDTATAASHRGRGIFTALTMHAVEELTAAGTDLIFNTPNDQSRPGYLKMGWEAVGRVPARIRPCRLASLPRLAQARTEAALLPEPTERGLPAADALLAADVAQPPATGVLRTDRTRDYLQWRYGRAPLHYRAVVDGDGLAFFRLRRRGPALEAVLGDVLSPTRRGRRQLVTTVAQTSGADHVLAAGAAGDAPGTLAVPGQGPTLTWRPLARPDRPAFALSLGDVELF